MNKGWGNGSSVLLHVTGHTYVHVGEKIYQFSIEDTVKDFFSNVGNNDVPYPIVLGSKNVYFMLDHTYLPRTVFPKSMNKTEWADAYMYYYGYKGDKQLMPMGIPMKNYKVIHKRLYD